MAKIYVVYFSGYGHTQRIAEYVAKAARAELIAISPEGEITEAQWQALDAADGIIFGSPTYMGSVAWQFKKFADATSKRWFNGDWKNKFAAGFTISASPSGDKLMTLQYFFTLAMQHGMIWIGQDRANNGTINRIGSNSGLMAQVGPTSPAADIPEADLQTATIFGERLHDTIARLSTKS